MSVLKDEQTGTWKVIYRYTDYFGEKKQTRLTDLAMSIMQLEQKMSRKDSLLHLQCL